MGAAAAKAAGQQRNGNSIVVIVIITIPVRFFINDAAIGRQAQLDTVASGVDGFGFPAAIVEIHIMNAADKVFYRFLQFVQTCAPSPIK